jgi:pyridoxamine 5'-phosphate oxidase
MKKTGTAAYLSADKTLDKTDLKPDPFVQFRLWMNNARKLKQPAADACVLSTADLHGRPSSRVVLLKGVDKKGFLFFTNYFSRKGEELNQNPYAALNFYWYSLERQIRIEGTAKKLDELASDAYFNTRPKESQAGAWVSPQSKVIESRETIIQAHNELLKQYGFKKIPRPEYWGGFRLIPTSIEFWQGRKNRLHDRFAYSLTDDNKWKIERLAP